MQKCVTPTDGHRPAFTLESTQEKIRLAEDVWNSRNPERVSLACYTHDSFWRNRGEFIVGRDEAILLVVKRQWGSLILPSNSGHATK
ncbi:DUF1348 family protein [Pectobacterium brasiliense]|uniref:DUF1348 family protein n=1 Tax=Pectobacterium brasiliense TaxID=180957 RepID=UPI0009B833C8|nr:DUF1348 family protein [Pectobacterium brasiliense]